LTQETNPTSYPTGNTGRGGLEDQTLYPGCNFCCRNDNLQSHARCNEQGTETGFPLKWGCSLHSRCTLLSNYPTGVLSNPLDGVRCKTHHDALSPILYHSRNIPRGRKVLREGGPVKTSRLYICEDDCWHACQQRLEPKHSPA
jgi:hypothetical protein